MANQLFAPSGKPLAGTLGNPQEMIDEFASIEDGFDILNISHFLVTFDDLNAAGSRSFVATFKGDITLAECVIDANNAGSNTVITMKIGLLRTAVVMTTVITQASTDTAGNIETSTTSSAYSFTDGERIEVVTDGGGTSVMPGSVMVYCTRTA